MSITLIGTRHDDPSGYSRLTKILNKLKPRKLTLESDSRLSVHDTAKKMYEAASEEYGIVESVRFPKNLEPMMKYFSNNYGYEIKACLEYSMNNGAELVPVDGANTVDRDGRIEERYQFGHYHLLSKIKKIENNRLIGHQNKNIEEFDPYLEISFIQNFVDREYLKAESGSVPHRNDMNLNLRDLFMADRIRNVMPDVHVTGMGHIYDSRPGNLYNLLSDLGPRRMTLIRADSM